MNSDPKNYYARLGVDPSADAEAITAAFRRRARIVHPDVPGTGDTDAFVALKAAYDVLADPLLRAAYDRSAHIQPFPFRNAPAAAPVPRQPRMPDLPVSVWATLFGAAAVTAIFLLLRAATAPDSPVPHPPRTAPIAANPASVQQVHLTGSPTHYVTPSGPATLWVPGSADDRLRPAGRIAPFTGVHALGLVPEHGLMAVALSDDGVGFVDAGRLTPGDAVAARQAYCADQAGAPPGNAELLARRGDDGNARLVIHNHGEQPAVVKLRDPDGRTEAALYVSPRLNVTVVGLPSGPWRTDIAVGELWSRACGLFAAGMRAQRLSAMVAPGTELTLPLNFSAGVVAEDIPDEAFVHN
ncbi:MAG TPA: J domain-containing protein [Acetobacteraceae bacterium]|nr:J domain-containing protein [Acetobacteraceae bacterium]